VGGGQHYGAVEANFGLHFRRQAAKNRAGLADGLENAPRQAQPGDEFIVPVPACGPHQGGGGSVGILVGGHAGQLVVQVVRHHQKGLGRGQLVRVLLFQGGQLVGSVEGLVLDAGAGVVLGKWQHRLQRLAHALGTAVPVGHRIAQDLPCRVQQHKVHGPGVNAHRFGRAAGVLAGFQPGQDVLPQAVHLPAAMAVFLGQAVFKAVDLFQVHAAILYPAQDVTAGRCADVDGKMIGQCATPLLSVWVLPLL